MEENKISYKQLHEQFMTNLNGTTNTETFLAVTPNYFSVLLACMLAIGTEKRALNRRFYDFCIDFIVIVGTAILSCTVLVNHLPLIVVTLFILCCSTYIYKMQDITLNGKYKEFVQFSLSSKHKYYITNFRALINMLTCVSILAVDFTVFPRRFAKTETFGYSPMDAGVGLFCISNSVIMPSAVVNKRVETNSSFSHALIKTLKSCIPLVVLGGARFFSTTQVDYQVHVSEYGVHWNFFITLAVSKLISFFVTSVFGMKCSLVTSLIVITVHEIALWKGLQSWVFSDISRDSFLTANREGIASSLGYVALFSAGIGVGNLIYCESNTIGGLIVLIKKFTLFSVFLWSTTFACKDCLFASRRLANFGYYMWILTFSVTTLTVYMLIDLFLQTFRFCATTETDKKVMTDTKGYVPVLFSAINYNGLVFFLIANLLTGLINLSIQTLRVNETFSMIILFLYSFVTCMIIYFLYSKNIKLKAW